MELAQTTRHLLPSPRSTARSVQAIRVTPETFGERRRVREGPSCCCPRAMLAHGRGRAKRTSGAEPGPVLPWHLPSLRSGRWYISPLFNLGQRLQVESGRWGAGSGEAGMGGAQESLRVGVALGGRDKGSVAYLPSVSSSSGPLSLRADPPSSEWHCPPARDFSRLFIPMFSVCVRTAARWRRSSAVPSTLSAGRGGVQDGM